MEQETSCINSRVILDYIKEHNNGDLSDLLKNLDPRIDLLPDPDAIEAETHDIDDDYLVALAREHAADFIETGDKDLLEWEDQTPPAITPAAFEQALVGPGN